MRRLRSNPPTSPAVATSISKATWSTAYVNDLPDSAFLYIEPGGKKDSDGRTEPRSLRHFPFKDADGKIDVAHLRNAISRIPQAKIPEDKKKPLQEHAQRMLAEATKGLVYDDATDSYVDPATGEHGPNGPARKGAFAAVLEKARGVIAKLRKSEDDAAPANPKPVKRTFQGIPLVIDRPKGFVMTGVDDKGKPWARTYSFDYGFIEGTQGGDGEGLDVFVGSHLLAPEAHWIAQLDSAGNFDEYKIMLGFADRNEAKAAYLAHVPKEHFGSIATMPVDFVKALIGIDPTGEIAKANPFVLYLKRELERTPVDLQTATRAIGEELDRAVDPAAPEVAPTTPVAGAIAGEANFGGIDNLRRAVLDAQHQQARLMHRAKGAMGDTFDEHAKAWIKSRGLLDPESDYGGELGRAIQRMARVFSSENHSGMSALYARAYFSFLCDAWDGMHTMILNDDDFARAKAAVAKIAKSIADAFEGVDEQVQTPTEDRSSVERTVKLTVSKAAGDAAQELRYVLGIVLEPDVVDSQGDTYSADEIRKSAWQYMRDFRNIGLMHKGLVNGRVVLVESYIAPVDFELEGSTIKAGTWMMGLNVVDDDLWASVKSGDLTGLSIAGFATKTPA